MEKYMARFFLAVSKMPYFNNLGQQMRNHISTSFKTPQELKQTCAQYGPTAPFTLSVLDSISGKAFLPCLGDVSKGLSS